MMRRVLIAALERPAERRQEEEKKEVYAIAKCAPTGTFDLPVFAREMMIDARMKKEGRKQRAQSSQQVVAWPRQVARRQRAVKVENVKNLPSGGVGGSRKFGRYTRVFR